jgi:murein DD-endopeptidase MepM/ murein hydrolase activator NlpD
MKTNWYMRALALGCALAWALSVAAGAVYGQSDDALPVADRFSPPLGFRDGKAYAPRIAYSGDRLIENTDYGVTNPDLVGTTCFGRPWETLYHAGEDLYREDGESTAGAEVTAVADGRVVYANPFINYPGLVVILEHRLPAGDQVYSVYIHLDDTTIDVTDGDVVERGQRLGTVLYSRYAGRFPEQHPDGDDSHLHFEIRYFYDASTIYVDYPACNGRVPGRGYTYPTHPDDFPLAGAGYTDPSSFVENRSMAPTEEPTPSPTASRTPASANALPTGTPVAIRPVAPLPLLLCGMGEIGF